jgi:hypothetical protein
MHIARLLGAACAAAALHGDDGIRTPAQGDDARAVILGINALGLGAITAYGFAAWDWGSGGFALRNEGWFGSATPYGGADKLGHAFTGSAITAGAAAVARSRGADSTEAALLGGATGAILTTAIEVGDGFSAAYGASYEDQVFNLLGVGFEVVRQMSPWFAERAQFRWEWLPSPMMLDGTTTDPFSDYSGSRYLLAFPAAPWVAERNPLRFVELLAGYGTTGFDDRDRIHYDSEDRTAFIGIGFHIGAGLDATGLSRPGRMLEHAQVPYTAWPPPSR